nr:hypothetical protein [Clostridia bacterium]
VWPFDDTPNTFALPTYEENYNYVRNFLMTRHGDILPQIAAWETPDLAALRNCAAGEHTLMTLGKAPTCTETGHSGTSCSVCGKVIEGEGTLPALGHTDANGDRLCDRCDAYIGGGPSWLHPLLRFFAKIISAFMRMFGR